MFFSQAPCVGYHGEGAEAGFSQDSTGSKPFL